MVARLPALHLAAYAEFCHNAVSVSFTIPILAGFAMG